MVTMKRCVVSFVERMASLVGPGFVCMGYSLIVSISYVHFSVFLPLLNAPSDGDDTRSESASLLRSSVHHCASVFLMVELLLQYSLAVWSNPGYVVPADHKGDDGGDMMTEFCKKCARVKPRRAHHCRICRTCVLEMDHHCPWINNCVGYYNYRFFWLLLMYLWISCFYVATISFAPFLKVFHAQRNKHREVSSPLGTSADPDRVQNVLILFSFLTTSALGVVLFGYWLWHVYLVLTQQTTIEVALRSRSSRRGGFGALSLDGRNSALRHRELLLRNVQRMLWRDDAFWFVALALPLPFGVVADTGESDGAASDAMGFA